MVTADQSRHGEDDELRVLASAGVSFLLGRSYILSCAVCFTRLRPTNCRAAILKGRLTVLPKTWPKTCKLESDGTDVFVVFNGVKIAKRGYPGTPQSKTWIPLEPGYTVLDIAVLGIGVGYLLAWSGHLLIEGNRPTMLRHPLWSLLCDLRMFRHWLVGRLDAQLQEAGVVEEPRQAITTEKPHGGLRINPLHATSEELPLRASHRGLDD
jgi:hypothetical protein